MLTDGAREGRAWCRRSTDDVHLSLAIMIDVDVRGCVMLASSRLGHPMKRSTGGIYRHALRGVCQLTNHEAHSMVRSLIGQ